MSVDLPAMLGPVTSHRRSPSASRWTSLGTKRPAAASSSTTGCRPSSMSMEEPASTSGRDVVVAVRHLGERGVDVPLGESAPPACGCASPCLPRLAHERREELVLALAVLLFGVHDAILQIVELVVGVALAAGHGLLAAERVGRLASVRSRDLDVPAEDPRVADLRASGSRRSRGASPRARGSARVPCSFSRRVSSSRAS